MSLAFLKGLALTLGAVVVATAVAVAPSKRNYLSVWTGELLDDAILCVPWMHWLVDACHSAYS